jgi:glycosyltransferase involved in cell wall biosynthesis
VSSPRVLFLSAEPVGERMAGPSIRAFELAKALSSRCAVTLAAPAPSSVDGTDIDLVEAGLPDFEALLALARRHDVLVAERLPPQLVNYVMRLPIRFVADLYNPIVVEVLEAIKGKTERSQRILHATTTAAAIANCAAADFLICASEKQRDLWLGAMAAHGLVDLASYRVDPSARSLIDVVPSGMARTPPARVGEPVLKGVLPGIGPRDRVLVWGGGIWNWLDPLTPVRAIERLSGIEPAIHLVFPGLGRPTPLSDEEMAAARTAVAEARARGLEGRRVHFGHDWVPYEQRSGYLTEADLGVSAHLDHLEARFSFRTRVVDYLWARLPVVTTRGDALAELVERRGLGDVVDPGDDRGFADACLALLEDRSRHGAAVAEIERVAPSLWWERTAQPLLNYCLHHRDIPPRPKRAALVARATLGQYPRLLIRAYDEQGPGELRRKVIRNFARALRRPPRRG